jgi:hypothetical protein
METRGVDLSGDLTLVDVHCPQEQSGTVLDPVQRLRGATS